MSARRRQRGAALLLFLVVAVIAFTAALVSGFGKWATPTTASRNVNAQVLAQAKTALIGYVAKEVLDLENNDIPGLMPCPESPADAGTSNEGRAGSVCDPSYSTNKNVGRLPWRTLGVDKLVDAAGEPLWYAVSPGWVLKAGSPSPISPVINPGTAGQLSFDGTSGIVAVIIAPGRPIATSPTAAQIAAGCVARSQARGDRSHVATSASDPDYRDYLECQNATAPIDSTFGTAIAGNDSNEAINDQAVFITAADLLNAIQGPVAERLQRTIAPLLSEHADKWITASGGKFLPYAVSFASGSPETSTVTCGTANVREGTIPTAVTTTAGCSTDWGNFSISGTSNSVESLGCSGTPVTCTFRYYTLNSIGAVLNFLLNLLGLSSLVGNIGNAAAITATITADAPNAAVSFRDPLANASVTVNPNTLGHTMTLTPKTTGAVTLSIQVPITSGTNNLCTSLVGVVCNLLPGLLATPNTVTVTFPQLTDATVAGAQLPAGVFPTPHTLNLLAPAAGEPHYWFFTNAWYRYTYYAISRTASGERSGGWLTVSGFPTDYGNANDKSFVLAVAGPALTSQGSRPSTSVDQYLEGGNASPGDNSFAYQVFSVSGNDRIAACPFTTASTSVCD